MKHLYVLCVCAVLLCSSFASAGSIDDLAKKFCSGVPDISWSEVFKQDIMGDNASKVISVTDSFNKIIEERYGKCRGFKINKKGRAAVIDFYYKDDVYIPVDIEFTRSGISKIWFTSLYGRIREDSFEKIVRDLNKLQGKVSVVVRDENGKDIFALNADEPLAIGSAFKLFVMRALVDKIKNNNAKWSDVVVLKDKDWSHPTGEIVNWIPGTPITLATLATLMISISDNTAADMLVRYLGRKEVEAYAPHSRPFLTTREMFLLKGHLPASLAKRYAASDENGRRHILESIRNKNMGELKGVWPTPKYIDSIEWFASVRELSDAIWALRTEKILTVNPGLKFDEGKWSRIAYKGGSEPWVIQYTFLLKKKGGGWYIISATWNDSEKLVNNDLFANFVMRIANIL